MFSGHEIFCWAVAIGVCSLLFAVILIVDWAWNSAYEKGFQDAMKQKT